RPQDPVVAGLKGDMEVTCRRGRLPQRRHELRVDVVDLDGREPEAREPGDLADRTDEPGQRVAGSAVAVAAEVDAGEDDLLVALSNAPTGLVEHRGGDAAPGRAANRRDHAEGTREAAPVLD